MMEIEKTIDAICVGGFIAVLILIITALILK